MCWSLWIRNLRYQQNLASRRIAIVILQSSSNRLDHLRQHFPACVLALEKIKPGEIAFASAVPLKPAPAANSDAQNADLPRVRHRNQPVLLPRQTAARSR